MREYRVRVMEETLAACRAGAYTAASGRRVALDRGFVAAQVARGRLHRAEEWPAPAAWPDRGHDAVVDVVAGDCLVQALALQDAGLNPACLNMASHKRPGGGYLSGAGAQEENLFRRTNYFEFIENGAPGRPAEIRYPLPEFGGIYSPDVYVLRGPESAGYPFLEAPRRMSFVAVAAYANPPVEGGRLTPDCTAGTKGKIRLILDIMLTHGHDAALLSAFGCGAFHNPPGHMAELFRAVIDAGGYRRAFAHLRFAILDDGNALRRGNPEGNLAPFARVFGG